jgi:hypothetical protein
VQILAEHADHDSPEAVTEQSSGVDLGGTRRRRARIGWAMIAAGSVLVLGGLWLGVTVVMARGELNAVRAQARTLATELSASNWSAAQATATNIASHARRADQLTSGPVWALAAAVPSGGEPLKTVRGITAAVDSLGHNALPQLVDAGRRLNPRTLRRPDGIIDLARIIAVAPAITSASANLDQTTKTISELPQHTWLRSVDASYADALRQVTSLDSTLTSAALAVRILPTMLGQNGTKRYFLAFQNDAEARGTGGLPGAFAILEANHGKLSFTRMQSDTTLTGIAAAVNFGPDYAHLYAGNATTTNYVNGKRESQLPLSRADLGVHVEELQRPEVDGVIAVDPTALSYLLAVTGPATLPDNTQVSGDNAVALTQSTSYAKFPGTSDAESAQRKAYLMDVASAASKKILDAHSNLADLLRAAGQGAGQRRLLVWSADPAVQANLAQTPLAGIIPTTTAPYIGLVVNNGGGNKLDYYLDRSLTWQATGCGPTRPTTVTITLTNNAPASGLPPYVTGRVDTHPYTVKPGDNRLIVSYFATQGAVLKDIRVAGGPAVGRMGTQLGHPVYTMDVELPRGTSRTIVIHLSEPAGTGTPILLPQPLVRPLHATVNNAVCNRVP